MESLPENIEPGIWKVTRERPTLIVVGMALGTHLVNDPTAKYRFTNYGPGSIFITTNPETRESTTIITKGQSLDLFTNYALITLIPSIGTAEGTYQVIPF